MFGETYPLKAWLWKGKTIQEEVQAIPWSSGPMIFTHLKLFWDLEGMEPKIPQEEENSIFILGWTLNPIVKNEYNKATGEYWV
jgi:hypothetical protein